jgi:hypothetical protein
VNRPGEAPRIAADPARPAAYGPGMKFGLFAINYGTCGDPEAAVRVARHAEAAGFESVWTGEHVVLPDPRPERLPFPPTLRLLDPIVALSYIAAHTSSIGASALKASPSYVQSGFALTLAHSAASIV